MDRATQKYINDLAQVVIERYSIQVPIVNIDEVVSKLGGTIIAKDNFDDLCDGTISKKGNNSFDIAVATHISAERKNFTVAHELGHLFLHMGFRTDIEKWEKQTNTYRRFGATEQEYQANEFAAALLMPQAQFVSMVKAHTDNGVIHIEKVAEYFNVSKAAAINRGRFLGCIL